MAAREPSSGAVATRRSTSAVVTSSSEGLRASSALKRASRAARAGWSSAPSVMVADARAAAMGSKTGVVERSNRSAVPVPYPDAGGGMRSTIRCGRARNSGSSVPSARRRASRCFAGATIWRTVSGTTFPASGPKASRTA